MDAGMARYISPALRRLWQNDCMAKPAWDI